MQLKKYYISVKQLECQKPKYNKGLYNYCIFSYDAWVLAQAGCENKVDG